MKIRLDLFRSFCISIFLVLAGLQSMQAHADGIVTTNTYVEIKTDANPILKARKQTTEGLQASNGHFVIVPERTNICQSTPNSAACNTVYSFSGLGYVPSGSVTSINFRTTPANSYLVFINSQHNSKDDRTAYIGEIEFENEILGYWTDPTMTVELAEISKEGASYPHSGNSGFSARQTEDHVHYGSSTTASTTSGDWVSISSNKRILRIGSKNGKPGDYIRVITRAASPTVAFSSTSSSGAESVSSAALNIDLSYAATQNVSVNYTVTGTATGSGTDYTLASGSLTINAGLTSGSISIAGIVNDSVDEPNETVIVTLSSPTNATLGNNTVHTYTIIDNDNPPVVDFNTTTSNGAESSSSKDIAVDLSAASGKNVTVNYAVTGTATGSGTDYTLASGIATISPGSTSTNITIAGIVNDSLDEADETVVVTLSNPNNATLGSNSVHTYTITDNDNPPSVAFNTTTSSQAESVSSVDLTVDLSAASGQSVTVNYAVTGTATGSGTDYTLANGMASIAPGSTSTNITIAGIVNDSLDEANETVVVTLSSPTNATLGSNDAHTYTIVDNDNPPVVQFNATSSNGAESSSSTDITVDLSAASSQNVTVNYAVTGTATGSGTDYTLANGMASIAPGSTSTMITIGSIVNDSLNEANETVILTLSSPNNATLGSNSVHTYTITDNDSAPVVAFEVTSSDGLESVSSKDISVNLSEASGQSVTVNYAVTGTATGSGTDYTLADGMATIAAGSTSTNITIAGIVNDGTPDGGETVILTLSSPNNATLGSNNVHTYTILEPVGDRNISFASATSSGAESTSSKDIAVNLSATSAQNVTVDYVVTGTATGSGTDYTLANGMATIAPNSNSTNITIASIIDDSLDEANETVIVTLSNPSNADPGSIMVHTYTITDNDNPPVVDFNSTSSSRAESVSSESLTVDLSAASGKDVTVNYAVTGTATGSGTDYTLADSSLTIDAGATTGIIDISGIIDDSIDEANETVIVTLSNPSNATLGSDEVYTYTITDNDDPPVIDFNATNSSGAESVSSADLTVDLSAVSEQDATVNFVVTGTATGSGTDYTLANGSLTIDAGLTSGTISIAGIVNDSVDEADETVIVTLSSPGNATLGNDTVHTYTITDNDDPPVIDFNATSSSGAESSSSKDITVDLSAASGQDVTVNYAVTGTATGSGTDYTLANDTLTISAGATNGIITISNIIDDTADEDNETVILTLSSPNNATLGSDSVHTYTITDNDNAPEIDFNVSSSSGAESTSSASLTVDLSAASSQSITVDYAVTGTATGSGTDYTLANGKLTISAGATSGIITIAGIIDDSVDELNETVIVTLSNPTNASLGSKDTHTYTITDNDGQPTIDFGNSASSGAEDISSVALTVYLSAASSQNVTVNYAVTGTATGSGTDYTLANDTLTISAGATSGTITIAGIVNDELAEANETVIITLSGPSNAVLGNDSVHTYTIKDDDGIPEVAFSASTSTGSESVASRSLSVVIPFASLQQIAVDYSVTGGTAGSGTDYSLSSGSVLIEEGATSGTIVIPSIVDDSTEEADETIIITLSNPTNAILGSDIVHTVIINDNDFQEPVLTKTGPQDDSTGVPINSDIVLTFNKVVDCETGTIDIKAADNSSSFAVTLPNAIVTGCGTETITINLPADLEHDTEYYVLIENTAFDDIFGNSFNGISDITEFNFKTRIELTDPTLKQPVIDNAKAMNRIATRWVDQNINAISKRMTTSSRQGFRVNFDNNIIDSIKTSGANELDNNFIEEPLDDDFIKEPIVEFCTINSSGPKTASSLKIKVHLSKIAPEDIAIDFKITGSSAKENFSFGEGILDIEAGLKSAIIMIEGIPQDRFGFTPGDRKIIVSLLESSNALLGKNSVYTHTLTDDLKAWTDPNANYFCLTDFDDPSSYESIIAAQRYDQNKGLADPDSDNQISNLDIDREEVNTTLNTEQLKSAFKEWVSDPVTVTAEGELKEAIGDWSIWIDGEFGEFTLGKIKTSQRVLDERSFHLGIDKLSGDDGDLFGFALGLGETKPKDRNNNSNVESRNYSISTYGKFDNERNSLQYIFGIGRIEFDSDRLDRQELLKGEREANQLFGSLAFIRSLNNENNNWQISPYLRMDGSYTEFDKYSEIGGEAALTFDELTLSNAKASIGTDISYLFAESKYNAMPYISLEYGLDYSKTSSQNMYYNLEGPNTNYKLKLDDGMKAHNWEVDIGLMLEISRYLNTNIGCRWEGRSNYLSDFSGIDKNDISTSEVCFFELIGNF